MPKPCTTVHCRQQSWQHFPHPRTHNCQQHELIKTHATTITQSKTVHSLNDFSKIKHQLSTASHLILSRNVRPQGQLYRLSLEDCGIGLRFVALALALFLLVSFMIFKKTFHHHLMLWFQACWPCYHYWVLVGSV